MAKSRYEYVKLFEKDDSLLPNTWIVVRLDGRGFHGFSKAHNFTKPNDVNALKLMNKAATAIMREFSSELTLAYGDSDEYRDCKLYNRREFKIVTAFVSLFTSTYIFHWNEFFPDTPLKYPPSFDGRAVLYPDSKNVRDYFAWRQADCPPYCNESLRVGHINNLHNTTYWALVDQGMTEREATKRLEGTEAADKNEILWAQFGKNYTKEPPMFRKGTVVYIDVVEKEEKTGSTESSKASEVVEVKDATTETSEVELALNATPTVATTELANNNSALPSEPSNSVKAKRGRTRKRGRKWVVKEDYIDIIKDQFWESKPWLLG